MSNTDKDKPWYVRAEWYEPSHGKGCEFSWRSGLRSRFFPPERPCDLPPEPVRSNYCQGYRQGWRIRYSTHDPCHWVPVWPGGRRYNYTWGPTKEDRHKGWYGPDRADVRNLLVRARQEYNGSRGTDVNEPVQHHRHGPRTGGWWD